MSTVGQPIVGGCIPIDTNPRSVGLPPPVRRATASSPSTGHTIRQSPTIQSTPRIPPNSDTITTPSSPPASDASGLDARPDTPSLAELYRTSIPKVFGQKNDPPSYMTARLQHDINMLYAKFQTMEKRFEAYAAQSRSEIAATTTGVRESLGEMILASEQRLSAKFDFLFLIIDDLGKTLEGRVGAHGRPTRGGVPASQGIRGNRSGAVTAVGAENA